MGVGVVGGEGGSDGNGSLTTVRTTEMLSESLISMCLGHSYSTTRSSAIELSLIRTALFRVTRGTATPHTSSQTGWKRGIFPDALTGVCKSGMRMKRLPKLNTRKTRPIERRNLFTIRASLIIRLRKVFYRAKILDLYTIFTS